VLEHILDDTKAMQELFRVMRPGGMGVFQIPQDLNREKHLKTIALRTKKNVQNFWTIRPCTYLWTRLL